MKKKGWKRFLTKRERNLHNVTNTLQDYGGTDAGPSDCTDSFSSSNTRWEVQCVVVHPPPSHTGTETAGSLSPFSPGPFNAAKPVAALLSSDNRWTNGFCHLTSSPLPPCTLQGRHTHTHTPIVFLWSAIIPLVLWTRKQRRLHKHDFLEPNSIVHTV